MNKAFLFLLTILVTITLASSSILIIYNNLLLKNNLNNEILYYQSKLHLNFLKQYINSLNLNNKSTKNVRLDYQGYLLEANLEYINQKVIINLKVTHKSKKIRRYTTYEKIL